MRRTGSVCSSSVPGRIEAIQIACGRRFMAHANRIRPVLLSFVGIVSVNVPAVMVWLPNVNVPRLRFESVVL